ncbi:MAG: Isoleucine--tRNA ligase [Methanonatronarchaeales archaeon]|nr:Isoleucine--tRNA ligase [Methanonatronarchaeales archaeon]
MKRVGSYVAEDVEERVFEIWRERSAHSRARAEARGGERFYFLDGPPYTTGRIHLGTTWNKILKDAVLRHRRMKGLDVMDRPGWDMHGLPIEVKVEESLGLSNKKEIEELGVDRFVEECRSFALRFKDQMTEQFRNLGVWLTWEDPYMTVTDEYIEAAWWALKRGHERDLLERGQRVVNWCPRCETALADSEVDYREVSDPSIYVKLPVEGREDEYVLVWTTTPWTVPSNVAVAVHPGYGYARVRIGEEVFIVAEQVAEDVAELAGAEEHDVLDTFLGEDLRGLRYRHPLEDLVPGQAEMHDRDEVHRVYLADFVTVEKTGCVHVAPGHGPEDFDLAQEHGLPVFSPVDEEGRFTDEAGRYSGKKVMESNEEIIRDLDERGALMSGSTVSHRYGHCWRCDTALVFIATEQWFLKISSLTDGMLEEIDRVDWTPEWAGSSRFRDWVEGGRDWCISRQRYWGIPLPVWVCEECGKETVVGTVEELEERGGSVEGLHRPHVDDVVIECGECGGGARRVEDVLDVWFDSAVASWANLDYPRRTDLFEKWWPADLVIEGHDQARGWFYSQLGAGSVAMDRAPYEAVMMHGFTLDEEGHKMSKSEGNVVSPEEVIERYGRDTLRLYLMGACAPWADLHFDWDECGNVYRALNVFWNVHRFASTYMSMDDFEPSKHPLQGQDLEPEDRWILSRAQSVAAEVDGAMDRLEPHVAARALKAFVLDDLSRWYVRIIRDRTWMEDEDPSKLAAYSALHSVLMDTARIAAPFVPFVAEEIYQSLAPEPLETLHLEEFPSSRGRIDTELEGDMSTVRSAVNLVSNARQKAGVSLRWPVRRVVVEGEGGGCVKRLEELFTKMTNAKGVTVTDEWSGLDERVEPDMSVLGPAFGEDAPRVAEAVRSSESRVEAVEVDGEPIELPEGAYGVVEEVPEGYASSASEGLRVFVDCRLDDELRSEGYAAELIRRTQETRKEMELEEDRRIAVTVDTDEKFEELVSPRSDYVMDETRADELSFGEVRGHMTEWEVEGHPLRVGVEPL